MATQGKGKKLPAKSGVGNSDYYIPPLPVAVARPSQSVEADIMGWVAACVLVILLLPLLGMMYLDILTAKHDVKIQLEKVEKATRQLEQEKRKEK